MAPGLARLPSADSPAASERVEALSLRLKTLLIMGETLVGLLAFVYGLTTIRNAGWVLLGAGVVFGTVCLLLMERLVLSRLARIIDDVRSVEASGDLSMRVTVSGDDELASLATAINKLLEALQVTQQALRESESRYRAFNEELERRVAERTAALEAANRELENEVAERVRAEKIQSVAYRIAEAANREADLVDLLRYIREELGTIIDTRNFYIALYDSVHEMLHFPYYVDENLPAPGFSTSRARKLDRGLTEYVLRSGQPLLVTGEKIRELTAQGEVVPVGPHAQVWLGVPLVSDGSAIGVVAVQSYTSSTAYTPDDLDLLRFVSGQIAAAITRQRRNEMLRQQSAAIEASIDGLAVLSAEGEYIYMNQAGARMLGYDTPQALVGKSWRVSYGPEEAERLKNEVWPALLEQGRWRGEVVGRRRDGSTFPQELSLATMPGGALVAVVRDISERRRLEEQFRQAQKMEAVGQLAGGVAHDFNNLLTAISGYASLVRDALPATHPAREDIAQVLAAAERASNLTRQLLAFSRRQIIAPSVVSLNDIILNLGKMLRRLVSENIEMEIIPAAELGAVRVDPGQIEQVLTNLVVNAGDAMPGGGKLTIETANVTLDAEYARQHVGVTPGEYCLLAVSDTGCGMTDDVKARIFEPFFTTKPGRGTGLGLATCYGIVKQSGGHIWVYSEPGKGTTFKIYLPRVPGQPTPSLKREEPLPLLRGQQTVLLVEDEPAVRSFAARILRELGYSVLEAANGSEALRLATEKADAPIHLLLTDVVMPQMGGEQLARRLKAIHPEMKVLYISGYTVNAIVHQSQLDEGVAFLQKPFTTAALAEKVREVLSS